MSRILQRNNIIALAFTAIFVFAMVTPAYILSTHAQASSSGGFNWTFEDGNQNNQNYNPQTQINPSTVADLQVAWLFPTPGLPSQWASYGSGFPGFAAPGIATTPLVYQGIVYVIMDYNGIYALNAQNGKLIWTYELPYGPNATDAFNGGGSLVHFHNSAIVLSTNSTLLGGPTIWWAANNYHVYALDAELGTVKLTFADLNGTDANHFGITGNEGTYSTISPALVLDQRRGILITSASGTSASNSGRGFFRGWDVNVNPPKLLWTTYTSAPQDGSDPNWDAQTVNSMVGAYAFNGSGAVNLKTLSPSVQNATLYNDWGYIETTTCKNDLGGQSPGGVGESWGGPWVIDPNTGIAYVATNNRNPYDSPCMPGPDLWSASILAIDDQNGTLVWGFQATPHDSWDWDCSWNQILANETINGQSQEVVMKSCKNAYIFQLNAKTGALIWYWTPPATDLPRCQYCHIYSVLNSTQMDSIWPAPNNASFVSLPGEGGGFENDMAFDPVNNMIVAVQHNLPGVAGYQEMNTTNYNTASGIGVGTIAGYTPTDNATAYGINAATGQEVWHYFIPDIGYRGGVTISDGVAYLTLSTGYLVALNDMNGNVLAQKLIGGPLTILPSIGATANGTEEMFLPIAEPGLYFSQTAPLGDLVVLSLPPSLAAATVTATASTTVTTAGPTVTSTTSTGGVSSAAFYGVVAVAAIFIIATGFLAMRRRKPAS
ncbi:MAG TPA: PQQ-binding-like beta-propeller repeat protein [Nitrososphaerales archaeon]|nr:PQQ-binding-like beta-propeller repeat protein [Nitrososphaerales archaeon]